MRLDDLKAMDLEEIYDMMHGRSRCFREMCDRVRPQRNTEVCALPFGHKGEHVYESKSQGVR